MGNNHDKYFGSDKRKIIILGLDGSGKTSKNSLTQPSYASSARIKWTSIHKKQKISTSKILTSKIST
jgi:GTPase SAR1 family protein